MYYPILISRRSRSPIQTLPVELLTHIFHLGLASNYIHSPFLLTPDEDCYIPPTSTFQLLVSHVCSHWRQVAFCAPSLWTTLHFRELVDLDRARFYLERCANSPHLFDILVDTVATKDYVRGVTLCRDEFNSVFDIIVPYVARWRAFFLKVRDNHCKGLARQRLSTCGPGPNLETLQLYHFEDFNTVESLYVATYRPPVMVFAYELPRLKNISLIGVNLPWVQAPFLRGLHNLELALHAETVRPSYKQWERMLIHSPDLKVLSLHYSGPRLPTGIPAITPAAGTDLDADSDVWPSPLARIRLAHLQELSLAELDPSYLVRLCNYLSVPTVEKLALALPDQDFTGFVEVLAGLVPASAGAVDSSAPEPYFEALKKLTITALQCSAQSWRALLIGMHALEELDVDFARVGNRTGTERGWEGFFEVLAGVSPAGCADVSGPSPSSRKVYQPLTPLLPSLCTLRISGLSGEKLRVLMAYRGTVRRWCVRWCVGWKGRDDVLDELVEMGMNGMKIEVWSEPGDEDDEVDSESGDESAESGESGDGNGSGGGSGEGEGPSP